MIFVERWYLNNCLRNYNYIIFNSINKNCLIVDPTSFALFKQNITYYGLKPEAILITHEHYDHISAINEIKKKYGCPVYASFDGKKYGISVDFFISNDLSIHFQTTDVDVISSPGHTSSHVCFYIVKEQLLFCGDTVFAGGIGNTKDETANIDDLYRTIQIIKTKPSQVKLYPAHDYFENNLSFSLSIDKENFYYNKWYNRVSNIAAINKPVTTIKDEKSMNIFFHTDSCRLKKILKKKIQDCNARNIFIYLRKLKDAY